MKTTIIIVIIILIGFTGFAIKNSDTSSTPQSATTNEVGSNDSSDIASSKVLDLSGQGLTKAPSYIFDRTEIEELNLSNNALYGALQAEVRFLQNLKVLNLSNNNFTGVPAEVGRLGKLEVLNLSNNQLTGLPYEIGNLSNLKTLDLRGNAYSKMDLDRIKKSLPSSTQILID